MRKFSFCEEDWALSHNLMKLLDFLDVSYFPKVLNEVIPSLLLIITLSFTCSESKFCSNIKESQNILTMIVHFLQQYLEYIRKINVFLNC